MKKSKLIFLTIILAFVVTLAVGLFGGCDFVRYVQTSGNGQTVTEEIKQLREKYVGNLYTETSSVKYREKEQKIYNYSIQDAENELNECLSESELQTVYAKHIEIIGKIKTDEQYSVEEETAAIAAYRAAIMSQADESYDKDKYMSEQIEYLDGVYAKLSEDVSATDEREEMNGLLQDFYFSIHKEDCILSLIEYADISVYGESQKSILTASLDKCMQDIRACTQKEQIASVQEVYIFEVYRQSTVKKINGYIDFKLYRQEQAEELEEILQEHLTLAKEAADKNEADNAYRKFEIAVYEVPTDEELYADELKALKEELSATLTGAYKLSNYREAEGETVKELLSSFENSLQSITKKEDVLSGYIVTKNRLDEIKTAKQLDEEDRLNLIEELYANLLSRIEKNIDGEDKIVFLEKADTTYAAMKDRISVEGVRAEHRVLVREISAKFGAAIELLKIEVEDYKSDVYYREKEQNQLNVLKEEYIYKLDEDISIEEARALVKEVKDIIDEVKTNDDLWNDSLTKFRADLRELYGEAVLEEPESLTEANDYYELANIIDYYAFYQLSGTEFVCDTFRVKLNFEHNDATYERNEVYWHCELLKSAVDIQARFDKSNDYIIFSLTAYDFATVSNRETTEEKIKVDNGVQFKSDKTSFVARKNDFNAFPYYDFGREVKVHNSQQLWFALEKGYVPLCEVGSVAEKILNEAKNILREIIMEGMSDEEKIFNIYSWIGRNVQFDNQQSKYNNSSDPKNYPNEVISSLRSHFVEGGIFDRLTVCIGFSKTYLLLLRMEGITAKLNLSRMPYMAGQNSIEPMSWAFHAFVYIEVNGKWYYSDAEKGDDRGKGTTSLHYILLPKSTGAQFDEKVNLDLLGGDDLNYYLNFELNGVKTYVFNKTELIKVLDTIKNNKISAPVSLFVKAGYGQYANDLADYAESNNIEYSVFINDGFEIIVQFNRIDGVEL